MNKIQLANGLKQWQQYPAYKDSRLEWLGEIPESSHLIRLKYVAPISSEKTTEKPNNLPYLGLEHLEPKTGRILLDVPIENVKSIVSFFKKGDVLFGKLRPYLGKVLLAEFEGVSTTELLVFKPSLSIEGRFLFYQLIAEGFIDWVNSFTYGAKMPRVSPRQVANLFIPLHPLPEQQQIAQFLDRETAKIDTLIEKKEGLIELLKEKRMALISHVVTKGLNPDFPMKDSGVEWLGEIPFHWEVTLVKRVSSIFVPQRNKPQLNTSEGIPWITMDDLTDLEVSGSRAGYLVSKKEAFRADSRTIPEGCVIASCVGNFGVSSVNTTSVIINQQLQAYIPVKIDPFFLRYLVSVSKSYFERVCTVTTIVYVNQEGFAELPILLPPINEQRAITIYLNHQTAKIDKLIVKIRTSIDTLKEYRNALISSAVTGKIDVRNS